MKILYLVFGVLLLPMAAHAMDCTSAQAIAQAKAAFGGGMASPDAIQIENVGEGTLGVIHVCEGDVTALGQGQVRVWTNNSDGSITEYQQDSDGNITTSTESPNDAQNTQNELQALGQAEKQQDQQGLTAQQIQQDQQSVDQAEQSYVNAKSQCLQIEEEPDSSNPGLLGILLGNNASSGLTQAKCDQLKNQYNQAVELAQREDLTVPDSGSNSGN